MAKKVTGYVKLCIPAGKANPSPPVGPALGQRGLNIMEFCKAFNAATQGIEPGAPVTVLITAYQDRTFSFVTRTSPASYYIKKFAKLDKGSQTPGINVAGKIQMSDVREIAKIKMKDLNANDVDAAAKMIAGSARSMGVEVVGA